MTRCSSCPETCRPVPGNGPEPCSIMFVGAEPGHHEARRGIPFIGQTGQEFDGLYLPIAGLDRARVYTTNAVRCNMPDWDSSTHELANVCARHHLADEIRRVKPRLIVTLGAVPAHGIFGLDDLELHHGIPYQAEYAPANWSGTVMPLYHPAAGLHETRSMIQLREDFIALGKYLAGTLILPVDEHADMEEYRLVERVADLPDDMTTWWYHNRDRYSVSSPFYRHEHVHDCKGTGEGNGEGTGVGEGEGGSEGREDREWDEDDDWDEDEGWDDAGYARHVGGDAGGTGSFSGRLGGWDYGVGSGVPVGVDTEHRADTGEPYCVSFSHKPGHGYVVLAGNTRVLAEWARRMREVHARWLLHWALADVNYLQRMRVWPNGWADWPEYTDTMMRAWQQGNLPQGLKALAYRSCGMRMKGFDQVVGPHANRVMKDWLSRLADPMDCGAWWDNRYIKKREVHKDQLELMDDWQVGCDCWWNMYEQVLASGRLPVDRLAAKVLADWEAGRADMFKRWALLSDEERVFAENIMKSQAPSYGIEHVPLDEAVQYAARDADATLRVFLSGRST